MTYDAPTLQATIVPTSSPTGGTSTPIDLSSRIRGFSMRRGRQDDLSQWEPSTASLILDNKDGQLDELKAGSIAASTDSYNEVFVSAHRPIAGSNNVFSGFALDGFYPISDPKDHGPLVQLDLIDFLGWGAQWPVATSALDATIKSLSSVSAPSVYIKGDMMGSATSPTNYLIDYAATITDPKMSAVSSSFTQVGSIIPGEAAAATQITGANRLAQKTGVTFTLGSNFGFMTSFEVNTAVAGSQWIVLLCQTVDGTPVLGLRCNADGTLTATVWNSAGTTTASVTTSTGASVRHDDGQMHVAVVRVSTTAISIYTDCDPTVRIVGHSITPVTSGFVHYGANDPTGGTRTYGPFAMWLTAMSDADALSLIEFGSNFLDLGYFWNGDTPAQRLTHIYKAAGLQTLSIPTLYVQGTTALNGYFKGDAFSNIGDYLLSLGESLFGATYVDKAGNVNIRDWKALTTTSRFTTEVANLTDDPSPGGSPPAVRVMTRGRSAPLVKRVLNRVLVKPNFSEPFYVQDRSTTGHNNLFRYGLHDKTVETMTASQSDQIAAALDVLSRYEAPTIEVGDLQIKPWGQTNETNFVLANLDLEIPVHYSERPVPYSSSTALINGTYRIISEQWDWPNARDWTVTVRIAPA